MDSKVFNQQVRDPYYASNHVNDEPTRSYDDQWTTLKNHNPATHCDYRKLPAGIGPVNVDVGTIYPDRNSASAIHAMTQAGIAGTQSTGASAICLNGGYADDFDDGWRIIYTGSSGAEAGQRLNATSHANQNSDQKWTEGNKALRTSMAKNWPVRVLRGPKSDALWAPREGYRYDGLYMIRKCWIERGKTGMKIIRFAMERLHDQGPIFVNGSTETPPDYAKDEGYRGDWPRLDDDDQVQREVKTTEPFDRIDPRDIFIKEREVEIVPNMRREPASERKQKKERIRDSRSPYRKPKSAYRTRDRSRSPLLPIAKPRPLDRFARDRQF